MCIRDRFGYPADFPGKAAEEIFRLEYVWFARQMEILSGRAAHCRTGEEARQALSQGKTCLLYTSAPDPPPP